MQTENDKSRVYTANKKLFLCWLSLFIKAPLDGTITDKTIGTLSFSRAIALRKSICYSAVGVIEYTTTDYDCRLPDATSLWSAIRCSGALELILFISRNGIVSTFVGMIHLFSFDVQLILRWMRTAASTQCRLAPTCEHVSASPAIHVQWATTTGPLCLIMAHGKRVGFLAE